MGEELKKFLEGVGALTELWVVIYTNFRKQGVNHKEAIDFTKGMIDCVLKFGENNK